MEIRCLGEAPSSLASSGLGLLLLLLPLVVFLVPLRTRIGLDALRVFLPEVLLTALRLSDLLGDREAQARIRPLLVRFSGLAEEDARLGLWRLPRLALIDLVLVGVGDDFWPLRLLVVRVGDLFP